LSSANRSSISFLALTVSACSSSAGTPAASPRALVARGDYGALGGTRRGEALDLGLGGVGGVQRGDREA